MSRTRRVVALRRAWLELMGGAAPATADGRTYRSVRTLERDLRAAEATGNG